MEIVFGEDRKANVQLQSRIYSNHTPCESSGLTPYTIYVPFLIDTVRL